MLDIARIAAKAFAANGQPVPRPNGDGTPNHWTERCVKGFDDPGNNFCLSISALDLFYNSSLLQKGPDGKPDFFRTLQAQLELISDQDIKNRLLKGPFKSWSGLPYNVNNFVAVADGKVIAMVLHAAVYHDPKVTQSKLLVDQQADSFDRAWVLSVDEDNNDESLSVTALPDNTWSRRDSSEISVQKDLPLFAIGFLLLTGYVCTFLGELHPVYSRVGLGLVAMLTCGLAIAVTFGVCSVLKLSFSSIHYILLLLLIGIGIDGIMVVTKSLAHVDRKLQRDASCESVPHKIGEAMSDAGVSISATTVTNVVVFLVSASTSLMGFKSFSLWAAIGVGTTFVYTATFFVAALSLDQRRIEKGKRDIYCFGKPATKISDKNAVGMEFRTLSRFFKSVLGPFILRRSVSVLVLVLFAALSAVGIWGTTRVFVKFEYWYLYQHQTTAWKFTKRFHDTFNIGDPGSIYIRDIDFSTEDSQQMMLKLCNPENGTIARNKWVENGSVSCWLHIMRKANNITNAEQMFESQNFIAKLRDFLGSGGRFLYTNEIALRQDRTIEASRFGYTRKHLDTLGEKVQAMLDIRSELKKVRSGEEVFSYSATDVMTEQFAVLRREMGLALGLACGAVFVICFILSGHPMIAIICVTLVGLIVVDVVGFFHFSGYNLNAITLIVLTISVGIGVDFVLHVARSFQDQVGTQRERAVLALHDLGPSVFHAGFSTLLSICIPGVSRSYIFRAIFWGMFSLLVFAGLHGLILGPVLLALVGPDGWFESIEERRQGRKYVILKAGLGSVKTESDGVGDEEKGQSAGRKSSSQEDGSI